MCEEIAPYFPVAVLLGHSGVGDSFGRVDDSANYNIHEVIFLGIGLMCNYVTVCGGRMDLNSVVRGFPEGWKSLESESAMIVIFSLMCWK